MATTTTDAAAAAQSQPPAANDPRGGPPRGSSKAEKEAFWRDMASKMNVGPSYELLKPVGAGAYGYVWSAYDTRVTQHGSRGDVAIKRIQGAFDRTTDAKRLLREILLLRHLKHANCLQMLDLVVPPMEHPSQFNTVYIITEMMDTDLHKIVQSPQELTELHVQYFLYQMLKALKYIHSAGIIHRDLKPSNLLLNENCELKLCDFGLARTFTGLDEEEEFTEYVVTRWYRAPEVLLQDKHYTTAVDVWAVGCTFAEMLKGSAIFPGNDYIDQLYCITDILGTPSKEVVSSIGAKQAQHFLSTMEQKPPKKFSTLFPKAKPEAVDLLEKMLRFDPKDRISVDEALKHPYLKELYEPDDKSAAEHTFGHDLSCASLTKYHLKELILEQAAEMHPEHKATLATLKEYHKELYLKQAEARQQLEQRGTAAAAQAPPAAATAAQ